MNSPEPLNVDRLTQERTRLLAAMRRRDRDVPVERYAPWNRVECFMRSGRVTLAAEQLHRVGAFPRRGLPCLEVGYGRLGWLGDLLNWGLRESDLCGIELDPERARDATLALPGADLRVGDAVALDWSDDTFQLVIASTVFTSILDDDVRHRVAREIVRVLRPGGALLWYDFAFDNPANREVRGIGRRTVRRLFPELRGSIRSLTLAPPLARLFSWSPWLMATLEAVRPLRSHRLAVLLKARERE